MDADGMLDIIFDDWSRDDVTLWSGASGLTTSTTLDVSAAGSVTVADLDADGMLDLVVGNRGDAPDPVYSTVVWGSAFSARTDLLSSAVRGSLVADFTGDGDLDVWLGNNFDPPLVRTNTFLYPFGPTARVVGAVMPYLGHGCSSGIERDMGATSNRREVYRFESRVLDAGGTTTAVRVVVAGAASHGAELLLRVRSGDSPTLTGAFVGPDGTDTPATALGTPIAFTASAGPRYLQYEIVFRRPRPIAGPTLDSVRMEIDR